MGVSVARFGRLGDKPVEQFTLRSDSGVEVDIISYGVSVRDWRVPLRGGFRSVVLGFESFDSYPEHSPHLGSVAGRVANRIKGSAFDLDDHHYALPLNEGAVHLHGGPEGLGRQVWDGEADDADTSVRFTHFSPDGAMGYPGNVHFAAKYRLQGHTLRLDLTAETDARTPISLVQHLYFNLGTTDTVISHKVRTIATAYTELDRDKVATGAILPVAGTKYDLRASRTLEDPAGLPLDYDINLVLPTGRRLDQPVATVVSPDGDLTLDLWTDRPGLQFYNGVMTDVAVPGNAGRRYGKHAGFCLEDQAFPDALHNPHFPDIIYAPERPYSHWCEIRIA